MCIRDRGNITCIWNGFTYEGRENDYSFTDMYMINGQVVVVKADSGINSLADLAGKTVMTQVDSAALEVLDGDEKSLQDTFAGGKVETCLLYTSPVDDETGDDRGDREHEHGSGRRILRDLDEMMIFGANLVAQRLDRGVEHLGGNDHADTDDDDAPSPGPVSYTHLDVYKRQPCTSRDAGAGQAAEVRRSSRRPKRRPCSSSRCSRG